MLKIGHRGAAGHIPENTIESILKALTLGAHAVEIDVHLCASGELIVFHDLTLDRMTNGAGDLASWTLEELKYLRVSELYRIPTLVEVLDTLNARCIINIELKGVGAAAPTCNLIHKYIKDHNYSYDDFIISSFDQQELKDVFDIDKQIALGVLTSVSIKQAIAVARTVNATYINPNTGIISAVSVKLAQKEGYKVLAWTANMDHTILKMKKYGVDGIISDKPDRL